MYSFFNNEFLPIEKNLIHVSDLATQRGYGIFDFFKVVNGKPLFIEDYLTRFYRSAEAMRLPVSLSREELKKIIAELIQKNGVADAGIKMILTGGYSPDGYEIAKPNLIITQHTLTMPGQAVLEKGIKVITHEYVRDIPHVKTINYIMGIWLQLKVKEQHAADVLYHMNGVVSEFPRCNLFIVKENGDVVTPANRVLHGITRMNILKLSGKNFSVREHDVHLEEVYAAKEVFLTSTTKRILPIVQVDDKVIGTGNPGPVSLAILSQLVELERN
jgi:D-alanine transaminase/branched-chain amino acid aminotransferase